MGNIYSDKELLTELRRVAGSDLAPAEVDFDSQSERGIMTYRRRFPRWWEACVRAGLVPRTSRPLSTQQYQKFHTAALERSDPIESVYGLLVLVAGLPPGYISEFDPSWTDHLDGSAYQPVITVPPEITSSEDPWTFKVPEYVHFDGRKTPTKLPELLQWYCTEIHDSFPSTGEGSRIIKRIATDMRPIDRELTRTVSVGEHPVIRASDLRATAGVHLARQGASEHRIRNHLGIHETGWDRRVEDFFLWNYVQNGIVHEQFDPPDVVLEPETGEPRYS